MTEDKGVMVVASGMSVTSIYAQHVQNNDHATQNMLKPDSPCCLAIQLKTQYMSMLIIIGRLWVPRYPIFPSGPLAGLAIEKTQKLHYKRSDLRFFCVGWASRGKRVLYTMSELIAVRSCLILMIYIYHIRGNRCGVGTTIVVG